MRDAKSFYDFLSRYVDDVIYMIEGNKYVYGSHRTIKYSSSSEVGYTQVYDVPVGHRLVLRFLSINLIKNYLCTLIMG